VSEPVKDIKRLFARKRRELFTWLHVWRRSAAYQEYKPELGKQLDDAIQQLRVEETTILMKIKAKEKAITPWGQVYEPT
jgi:hypothetical protein